MSVGTSARFPLFTSAFFLHPLKSRLQNAAYSEIEMMAAQ